MTKAEAMARIGTHAGRTGNFEQGYVYALRYGFKNLEEQQQKLDEIFACLRILQEEFYQPEIDRQLAADVWAIQYQSILYLNQEHAAEQKRLVQIGAEVLAETMLYLLEQAENPLEAYDSYRENYEIEL